MARSHSGVFGAQVVRRVLGRRCSRTGGLSQRRSWDSDQAANLSMWPHPSRCFSGKHKNGGFRLPSCRRLCVLLLSVCDCHQWPRPCGNKGRLLSWWFFGSPTRWARPSRWRLPLQLRRQFRYKFDVSNGGRDPHAMENPVGRCRRSVATEIEGARVRPVVGARIGGS